jgi:outer membrane protein assembly factor BamE (lipoprotein component of BamABCDE complex)
MIPIAAALLACAACQQPAPSPNPVAKGNLTLGAVQAQITPGVTTKEQVLQWFGSPNVVTRGKEGEVWNYTRQGTATELKSSSVGAWFLVIQGGNSSGFARSGSTSFDLLLRFDTNDVVIDHKVLQTAF